uniref:translation initiation factor 1 n=1 Tax=Xyris capensis TaxID=114207 RepID=UPI001F140B75|nr:translation initiation factor 1 [Xyris capensis]YP_010291942.1 translation initiation factor 1 [Xyris capensis]ULQ68506.1 translation initiation factor 1 [Xyris capensis]ULQ68539.1 translation initiation factor 1 [Xyris capensis]
MVEKEKKFIHVGLVTDSFPNGMFQVRLDNGSLVLGYISGKIRLNLVRIMLEDKVLIEISPYDLSKGRIIYRFSRKDSDPNGKSNSE